VSIDKKFVFKWHAIEGLDLSNSVVFLREGMVSCPKELNLFAGWSPYSGIAVDVKYVQQYITAAAKDLENEVTQNKEQSLILKVKDSKVVQEKKTGAIKTESKLNCVLFGLGNYAKVFIKNNINKKLNLGCIHEIDPLQLGPSKNWKLALDTAGFPRNDERYDVYFIASYHHTHTPIALNALQQGAYAVIEKPAATSREQLETLRDTILSTKSKVFICFQKRYAELNKWVRDDLNLSLDDPISYHCIVYEVPLPNLHWYNWPHSQSRVVSNACHWIDHFMYLNNYCNVDQERIIESKNNDVLIYLELDNGANFTMTLTDKGSERIGLRENIELRAGDGTVRILDGKYYCSENTKRIVRKRKMNPLKSYQLMYRYITNQILEGKEGNSYESFRSSEVVISLEEKLKGKREKGL
jgi:predicted dehydrogenase